MAERTIDDASGGAAGDAATPALIALARTGVPAIVIPADGEVRLGRTVTWGTRSHEIDDERMSKEHAVVTWQAAAWRIRDLESRNGTHADGERIERELTRAGDVVLRLGHTVFLLLADGRGHSADPLEPSDHVVGPELARALAAVLRHADSDTMLIHGETGAGKEIAARHFHAASPRAGGPFVAVNCAAIPEGVAERLLFGAKKGAFSGAVDAEGFFEAADGGTLFLDEVAELEMAVQAKLLRAIEAREIVPIGATSPVAVDLAIVAASHRELRAAVAQGAFRQDLYYRLSGATAYLPPLRERKVDITRLVARELGRASPALIPHARLVEAMCSRPWPGNVRELLSAARHAARQALAANRTMVRVEDLPPSAGLPFDADGDTPARAVDPAAVKRSELVAALASARGVVSVAARLLGLHRTQLYRLMDKHGVTRDDPTK